MPNPLEIGQNVNIAQPPNMLGMAGQMVDIQNSLARQKLLQNENQQFQAQFHANQALGEIMAHAPDLETGIKAATANPAIMGYATQGMMNIKEMALLASQARQAEAGAMLAQTQAEGAKAGLRKSGYDAISAAIPALVNAPEMRGTIFKGILAGMTPEQLVGAKPQVQAIEDALNAKLAPIDQSTPEGKESARQATVALMGGLYAGSGGTPANLAAVTPTQSIQEFPGGAKVPVQTQPGFMQKPPAVMDTGEGGGASASALGPNPVGSSFKPITTNGENPKSFDGTPLFHPDTRFNPPVKKPYGGMGGMHIWTPDVVKSGEELSQEFNSAPAIDKFNSAQNSLSQLDQVDQSINHLASHGGLLTPGTAGELRGTLAQMKNTWKAITGQDIPMDESKAVGAWEDLRKFTNQLGMSLVNSNFGRSHEAASTILLGVQSVPSMDNTPLGAALLSAGVRASMQRLLEERQFINEWRRQPYTQGNLTGALEEFNRQHPAQAYAASALQSLGMGPDGKFQSPGQLVNLFHKGMFGPSVPDEKGTNAAQINATKAKVDHLLKTQFPDEYKKIYGEGR